MWLITSLFFKPLFSKLFNNNFHPRCKDLMMQYILGCHIVCHDGRVFIVD